MYWMNVGLSMLGDMFNVFGSKGVTYGVFDQETGTVKTSGSTSDLSNMSTIYMCNDILSRTIGMIPMEITKDKKPDKEHELYYQLRYKLSELANNQVLMSTIEFQRNTYGNSFVDIRKGKFDLIPIEIVDDWDWKGTNETLRYHLAWSKVSDPDKRRNKKVDEWVQAKDVLHFKGMGGDGVMGLPKITAASKYLRILDQAADTVSSFYENRAMSPMAVESTLKESGHIKAFLETRADFERKTVGTKNAGKPIFLPANTKLTPLQLQFADAELVNTMKFSRDEICNMYGLPSFFYNSTEAVQMDIEQQSRNFTMFTVSPILSVYVAEIRDKMLSKEEVLGGYDIKFDTTVLVETDLTSMANAYAKMIQSGICTPRQASDRFGFETGNFEALDWTYTQTQLIPLNLVSEYGHPMFNKMSGASINTDTQSNNNNNNNKDEGNTDSQ